MNISREDLIKLVKKTTEEIDTVHSRTSTLIKTTAAVFSENINSILDPHERQAAALSVGYMGVALTTAGMMQLDNGAQKSNEFIYGSVMIYAAGKLLEM